MYELLTGRGPFDRRSAAESIAAILETEPPSLADVNPHAPGDPCLVETGAGRCPRRVNDDFRELLAALLEAGARFLVVGAHAMAVHGVPRATGDLDVWVAADAANAQRVWDALLRFGAPAAATGVRREDLRPSRDPCPRFDDRPSIP